MNKSLFALSLIVVFSPIIAGVPGTVKWEAQLHAQNVASPTLSGDSSILYIGNTNNQLVALNTVNGSEKWHYVFTGGIYSPPAYDSENRIVYVTTNAILPTEKGGAYALQGDTGALTYSDSSPLTNFSNTVQVGRPVLSDIDTGCGPKVVAYTVFTNNSGVKSAYISQFDFRGGQERRMFYEDRLADDPSKYSTYRAWKITWDTIMHSACNQGIITPIYNGSMQLLTSGPAIVDQSVSSFSVFWQSKKVTNMLYSSPTIDNRRQAVYVGGNDEALYAYKVNGTLSMQTEPAWIFHLAGNLATNPPAIGSDGTIYVTSENGTLSAITVTQSNDGKLTAGVLKWGLPHLSNAGFASQPVVDNGRGKPVIYATDKNGTVYAVVDNGTSGAQESWSPLRFPVTQISSPPVIGSDGTIYLVNNATSGIVYAVYGPNG